MFQDKKIFVHNLFENIAGVYDIVNDVITFGFDNSIRKKVINCLNVPKNAKILDLCTGTGDIAKLLAEKYPDCHVVGVDFSEKMLNIARKKTKHLNNIEFIKEDVLNLFFDDDTFDICTVSYGLRNLEDIDKGLAQMQRVTKKGGYISNCDLGKPPKIINFFFKFYFFKIMPLLGIIFHKNKKAYDYLAYSSIKFPSKQEFCEKFEKMDLTEIQSYDYMLGSISQQIGKV
ncbi:MAG: ubiquinone/menaquinone biosynthesis methyltransferase [Candidatus Gastranaerophilales bacterium]|nr:ubiquinone/menaquinone biosynthesis methyltransferase [Candidatus Gastranaerophilales bacterium]